MEKKIPKSDVLFLFWGWYFCGFHADNKSIVSLERTAQKKVLCWNWYYVLSIIFHTDFLMSHGKKGWKNTTAQHVQALCALPHGKRNCLAILYGGCHIVVLGTWTLWLFLPLHISPSWNDGNGCSCSRRVRPADTCILYHNFPPMEDYATAECATQENRRSSFSPNRGRLWPVSYTHLTLPTTPYV